ncbi:MAG: hypothetical protein C5B49_10285 [Bdellovibrio sp.]|nr:MAG: hypothetical protein C5B49_10285 [Bdellovibrio sp.]
MSESASTTIGKALRVNQDPAIYGTFAEIGAGQEVARFFFQAGQASQTIAKTMSAYDMNFSDEIYGKEPGGRYVCEPRLIKMLDKEYSLLKRRLDQVRGDKTIFFAYANTVTTGDQNRRTCHGWMGIRFQKHPQGPSNDIVLHVRMLDRYRLQQQETLGILGVNLVSAAFYSSTQPQASVGGDSQFAAGGGGEAATGLIPALIENIRPGQVAIDVIHCSGPDLTGLNNHLLNLELVRRGLTEAVLFGPDESILNVADIFFQRPVLIDRGEFRPVTNTHLELIARGAQQFTKDFPDAGDPLILFELTMHTLLHGGGVNGEINEQDFLDRVQTLCTLKHHVLVSHFFLFYRLKRFLRGFTKAPLALLIEADHLARLFDEPHYSDLEGGLLEGLGKLLDPKTKIYVFPKWEAGRNLTADAFAPRGNLNHIFRYYRDLSMITDLPGSETMSEVVHSEQARKYLSEKNPTWEKLVPAPAAKLIKDRRLFGY